MTELASPGAWLLAAIHSVQKQFPALHGDDAERAARTVLAVACEAMENAYNPQNPAAHHPADALTKLFELEGHEGIVAPRGPCSECRGTGFVTRSEQVGSGVTGGFNTWVEDCPNGCPRLMVQI